MRNHSGNNDAGKGAGGKGGGPSAPRDSAGVAGTREVRGAALGRMRGQVRAVPFIGGFVLIMAAALLGGIAYDRPSVLPWGAGATAVICAVLAMAGVGLVVLSFVRPRPLADDEREQIVRASKASTKSARRIRLQFLAVAGVLLVWGVAWIVAGGVRFGWADAAFWNWASGGVWAVAAAAVIGVIGVLLARSGRIPPLPRDDEREQLVKLKADAETGRVMYLACILLEVVLNMLAVALESDPLRYMGLGFLIAFILYAAVSMIARSYYERRM
ncbi:DUF2178 domain-containing protein [Bifidobacterium avesanii]|uniref:DUF2178 domain-containing protein n=1 Tax=Bifidobacterium avesanii TaxID=1798157 RepID=A0A7K3TJZ2_9BIFI|nr:DUF2178 domain-containing protein [Bifidobacterium avesanii]KAB8287273.1 hypothetical protein DSM100685_1936 [Bifidobacterium avesanii]NEG79341.1 DUF2178 domain-containing protein [Bifidobacterium avesanii]